MFDIGVNLTNPQLFGQAQEVLTRAAEAGVRHCVITGTDLESSHHALKLVKDLQDQFPDMLRCTAGVHPHDAKDWNQESQIEIQALLKHPKVVAVGETGLDFNRNYSPPELQIAAFEAQLELASETSKPLFLHERDAFEKQLELLKYYRNDFDDAVIHCFTGDKKALFAYLDLNLHIGVTGWVCDERRGKNLAEIVNNIPLNRLMVETDAPFLLPRNIQPKPKSRTNEPAYLTWVIAKIAECYSETDQVIEAATTDTAKAFFKLEK